VARGLIPLEVVDDWRRQVWSATTADPGDWPQADFRGPYLLRGIYSQCHFTNPSIYRVFSLFMTYLFPGVGTPERGWIWEHGIRASSSPSYETGCATLSRTRLSRPTRTRSAPRWASSCSR
jgi:hypothetical protein